MNNQYKQTVVKLLFKKERILYEPEKRGKKPRFFYGKVELKMKVKHYNAQVQA